MGLPAYSDEDIRAHVSADSFQRGREYARSGAVMLLVQRGMTLHADVQGSDDEPYRLQVYFDGGTLAGADCTCPYDWGGWCKHIVGTLLAARERPDEVEERRPLAETLTGLSRDQLQALLLKLTEFEPSLIDVIEAQLALLTAKPAPIAPSAAPQTLPTRTMVDQKALRRQVRSLLGHGGGRSYRDYGYAGAAISAVAEVEAQAQRLIEAGDGRGALAVLEILTDEFISTWEELDDSDGESIGFFEGLGKLWAEALLTPDLTEQERLAWTPKLEDWQSQTADYGIDEAFDVALSAAVQGWDYPPLQRVLNGEIDEAGAWEGEAPDWADDLAEVRLNILDRQGRHQEYLYLAEAESQTVRHMTMLVRLGRGAEALAYARTQLTTPQDAHTLATALWERGEIERALACAELGLAREGHKAQLATWLRDRAAEQGQPERALAAATVAFEADQSLDAYLKAQQLAGPSWEHLRPKLLNQLRAVRTYYPQGPVEIFLHEGLIDDAIGAVDQGATHSLVELVAEAAIKTHPDWVIKASRQQAESIMDRGKSEYYRSAAHWLEKARDAYLAAGREDDWKAYHAELLGRHHRKYSLMPLLKQL